MLGGGVKSIQIAVMKAGLTKTKKYEEKKHSCYCTLFIVLYYLV